MITNANALLINTNNISRLINFYEILFNRTIKIDDHGGGRHAECDIGDFHFAIFERKDHYGRSGMTICFHTDDILAEEKRIKDAGLIFNLEPRKMPFGGIYGNIIDPDGNCIGLMSWTKQD